MGLGDRHDGVDTAARMERARVRSSRGTKDVRSKRVEARGE